MHSLHYLIYMTNHNCNQNPKMRWWICWNSKFGQIESFSDPFSMKSVVNSVNIGTSPMLLDSRHFLLQSMRLKSYLMCMEKCSHSHLANNYQPNCLHVFHLCCSGKQRLEVCPLLGRGKTPGGGRFLNYSVASPLIILLKRG